VITVSEGRRIYGQVIEAEESGKAVVYQKTEFPLRIQTDPAVINSDESPPLEKGKILTH
jgi:hypothetical protein